MEDTASKAPPTEEAPSAENVQAPENASEVPLKAENEIPEAREDEKNEESKDEPKGSLVPAKRTQSQM